MVDWIEHLGQVFARAMGERWAERWFKWFVLVYLVVQIGGWVLALVIETHITAELRPTGSGVIIEGVYKTSLGLAAVVLGYIALDWALVAFPLFAALKALVAPRDRHVGWGCGLVVVLLGVPADALLTNLPLDSLYFRPAWRIEHTPDAVRVDTTEYFGALVPPFMDDVSVEPEWQWLRLSRLARTEVEERMAGSGQKRTYTRSVRGRQKGRGTQTFTLHFH